MSLTFGNAQLKHITVGTTTVVSGGGRSFYCAMLNPGSAASTLTVYDNTAGSGTILVALVAAANGTSVFCPSIDVPVGIGITAVLAGTAATAEIWFA